jgi:polyhydroxybutyrate depolymerase
VHELRYTGCAAGAEVVLDTVSGGSHTWPGGPAAAVDATDSVAGKAFGATERILSFFARHHRNFHS